MTEQHANTDSTGAHTEESFESIALRLMGAPDDVISAELDNRSEDAVVEIVIEGLILRGIPRSKARMLYDIASHACDEAYKTMKMRCSIIDDPLDRAAALAITRGMMGTLNDDSAKQLYMVSLGYAMQGAIDIKGVAGED
jgi:hypothetical protein